MVRKRLTRIVTVFAFIASVVAVNLMPLQAFAVADDCTWTGGGADDNWSTAANWSCTTDGAVAPDNGDTLIFPAGLGVTMNNDISNLVIANMTFAGDYTLVGNDFTFGTGAPLPATIRFNAGTTGTTISANMTVNSGHFSVYVNGGNNTISGNITYAISSPYGAYFRKDGSPDANTTLLLNGNQTGSINAGFDISDTTNTGLTVTSSGVNTFTAAGVLVSNNARFACGSNSCFGANTNTVYQYDTGRFVFSTTGISVANPVNLNTSDAAGATSVQIANNVSATLSGALTVSGDTTISVGSTASTIGLSGAIATTAGKTLTIDSSSSAQADAVLSNIITGTGNLVCDGVNCTLSGSSGSWSGNITAQNDGVISVNSSTALGDTTGTTTIKDGSTLHLNTGSAISIAEPLTITGAGTSEYAGALFADLNADLELTGNITLNGNATIYNTANSEDLRINGVVSGTGDLTLFSADDANNGPGSLTLGGAAPNTYVGTTYVTGGNLYLDKTSSVPGDLTVHSADPVATHGTVVRVYGDDAIADAATVTTETADDSISFGNTVTPEVIGGLSGAAGEIEVSTSGASLIIDQNFNSTYGGDFYSDGNTVTITKRGTGTLLLTGTDVSSSDKITYIVEAGALSINGNLQTTTGGNVTVQGTGVLKGTGTVGTVTATAGKVAAGNSPGTLNVAGLNLASGTTFEVEIAGATAGTQYDQVISAGAVSLGNATLSIVPSYTPANGQVFTIITGASINGVFHNLPDGATITANGLTFRVHYLANSVTLTYVSGTVTSNGANSNSLVNTGSQALLTAIASILLITTAVALIRRPSSYRVR